MYLCINPIDSQLDAVPAGLRLFSNSHHIKKRNFLKENLEYRQISLSHSLKIVAISVFDI